MTSRPALDTARLNRAVAALPERFRGPGGAVAVVKDGEVVLRHAFGYSDLEARMPFAPTTLVPICSITKQFTCALMLDLVGDPAVLDGAVAAQMPKLHGPVPTAANLADNQSGLRDYWALTVLCGAAPEGEFRPEDAKTLIGRTTSLHFAPGTRYSYSNGNFRVLGTALEAHAGKPFEDLLMERIVRPAGMATAVYGPETRSVPGGAVGYDGDPNYGFVPGINRIHWSGDAGLCASLDDMIAWERFIDRTRDEPNGLYRRLSHPTTFADGNPAQYGLGLSRSLRNGQVVTGHGGALRGWRSHRLHLADARLSVVVLFNHAGDARGAALSVLAAALGEDAPQVAGSDAHAGAFAGSFLDDETGILLDLAPLPGGKVSARYGTGTEILTVGTDGVARSDGMVLVHAGAGLRLERPADNLATRLSPVVGEAAHDIDGVYRSDELGSTLTLTSAGGALYAAFDGFLGKGAAQPLYPVGKDVWRMPCQRSLDAPSPGDWTVLVRRDDDGAVAGVTFGCWLARQVAFDKA